MVRILLFLAVAAGSVYLFWTALYRKYQYLMLGQAESRPEGQDERIRSVFRDVLGQAKVLAEPAGLGHFFIFWGFIVLSFGTLEFVAHHIFGGHLPLIGTTNWFVFSHELFSMLVLVAILIAAGRRFFIRPMRLDQTAEAYVILGLIGGLVITDLIVMGLEVALTGKDPGWVSPVASFLGGLFAGGNETVLKVFEEIFVWAHLAILFGFLIFIPRSKHLHMIAAGINTYFRRLTPNGRLRKLDLSDESVEEFGVGRIDQFTWKQLLDGYACTECGRCHVNCPATLSGKPLSPKYLILKMRDHLTEVGDRFLAQKMAASTGTGVNVELAAASTAEAEELPMLMGNVYSEDEIWACTTCRACEEMCPVYNEHVDKIMDLRRWMVLTEGKANAEINRAFQNLERQSNEWGQNRNTRADWAKDLNVRTMAEVDGEVEYLYYVGSACSFDPRNQKIARSFVNLLNKAGVDFAILGKEEESDGDSARRLGNEFLFQALAEANVEIFKAYNVKKIVTTDPHAYNTFKNEYPDFGLEGVEVIHGTELLAKLIDEGKLKPSKEVNEIITYHDSCYLGRYNEIYTAPRYILDQIPGVRVVEMERNRERGMCCGAGGGSFWKEELKGTDRINVMRTEQAMETGCTMIGTACPFCMTMMIDGTKAKGVEDNIATYDVVELLDMATA
ncbi:Fe-S oxidoreductase [Effusibacillus lacus]|nr:Fe-S oxidoreductase [Effusibacillus lacus]